MPTLFTLSASLGHDIVCGIIAMSIVACVAIVSLGFSNQGLRVLQVLICGACLALRIAVLSGLLAVGEEDIMFYALAPAVGGIIAVLLGLKQWNFSIPLNPLGCVITAAILILLGFFACWIIWIVGVAVVIIGCISAIINGCSIRQRILAIVLLLLLLAPIAPLVTSFTNR